MSDRAKHAILSPSAAHRWLRCPASVPFSQGLPNPSSPFAMEGTAAHDLAYNALVKGCRAQDVIPEQSEVPIDQEMLEVVDEYCAYVREIVGRDFANSKVFYEYRVEVPEISEHTFGTLDAGVLIGDELHIIDFKYGQGYSVPAYMNPQLMIYALGMYNDKAIRDERDNIKKIFLHIMQPRAVNTHYAEMTVEQLVAFGSFARKRASAAYPGTPGNLVFIPGVTQCRFCLAKPMCPKMLEITKKYVTIYFSNFDTAKNMINPLSPEDRQFVLDNAEVVSGFIRSVQNAARQEIMSGTPVAGWKMVAGKRRTVWSASAADQVLEILGDQGFKERELIAVGKARKLLTKEQVESLTDVTTYADQFVPQSDERPALEFTDPALDFPTTD